ncbi:hypothetical protein GCM10017771_87410 [Streptomyces capitiformicae]|uniref:Uncharacterized protein n=1 Tax=Streptomyces capitiformicae TaxID=2014920 RepID=A0A918ZQV7_9ACTN|nr:hypothetical protein GCM10017771_87410 [Streptomyces capitiformicae]
MSWVAGVSPVTVMRPVRPETLKVSRGAPFTKAICRQWSGNSRRAAFAAAFPGRSASPERSALGASSEGIARAEVQATAELAARATSRARRASGMVSPGCGWGCAVGRNTRRYLTCAQTRGHKGENPT